MGLTKQYLRYVGAEVFSVVGSAKSNVTFLDIGGYSDRFCAVGACENVILWDMRKGEKVHLTQRSSKACKQIMFPPDCWETLFLVPSSSLSSSLLFLVNTITFYFNC